MAAALFMAGAIGGSLNAGGQAAMGRLPEELSDWEDPATMSTSRLSAQCGVLTEMKLVRTSRLNFLFLGIRNDGEQSITVRNDRVKGLFSNGRERYFLSPPGNSSLEIKPHWYAWGFIPFPRKTDFKDQDSLKVTVPVMNGGKNCEMIATFNRDKNKEQDLNSYTEAPTVVVSMGVGVGSGFTPVSADTFDNNLPVSLDFYFAGFAKPTEGGYLQMSVTMLGDIKSSERYDSSIYKRANLIDMSIGKAWRSFYSDTVSTYLNVGPSIGVVEALGQTNSGDRDSKAVVGLYASYTTDWRYARQYWGFLRGDYSLGLTLYAKYYPWAFSGGQGDLGLVGVSFEFLRGGE
ncbi:hypothetical protein [Bdellovibrio sp. HCB209]|uniref:hypothetical protein n=1 Tax=Bdellovibrio sp. HCB209 TaxID=3394354 RepID=UPI0039B5B816